MTNIKKSKIKIIEFDEWKDLIDVIYEIYFDSFPDKLLIKVSDI